MAAEAVKREGEALAAARCAKEDHERCVTAVGVARQLLAYGVDWARDATAPNDNKHKHKHKQSGSAGGSARPAAGSLNPPVSMNRVVAAWHVDNTIFTIRLCGDGGGVGGVGVPQSTRASSPRARGS